METLLLSGSEFYKGKIYFCTPKVILMKHATWPNLNLILCFMLSVAVPTSVNQQQHPPGFGQ